jgi:hypothetical protein
MSDHDETIERARVAHRLEMLRAELATGQKMLGELEAQEAQLRRSVLRIAGAVQVLEELLAEADAAGGELAGAPRVSAANGAARAVSPT